MFGSLDSVVTYGAGLLALAIIVRNGGAVSDILKQISSGYTGFAQTLIGGS